MGGTGAGSQNVNTSSAGGGSAGNANNANKPFGGARYQKERCELGVLRQLLTGGEAVFSFHDPDARVRTMKALSTLAPPEGSASDLNVNVKGVPVRMNLVGSGIHIGWPAQQHHVLPTDLCEWLTECSLGRVH